MNKPAVKRTSKKSDTVWIIGAGRVGRIIAATERKCSSQVILFDTRPGETRIGSYRFRIRSGVETGSPDRLWFCVPDDLLQSIIDSYYRAGVSPKLVIHTSGWHSPEVLHQLCDDVLSFHPMQSILGKDPNEMKGAIIALSGSKNAVQWGTRFSVIAGSRAIEVQPAEKPYIHLICQFAANFPFAIVAAIEQLSDSTTVPKGTLAKVVTEMVSQSTHNALRLSAATAATGPVARNDRNIINRALAILETQPELRAFYESYARFLHAIIEREKPIV